MDVVRKSIGVLIILFIGGPILFGVIWAVGVTRAVVSPEFLSDLPREIIQKVPEMINEILVEVNREDMVKDPNTRAWVKAAANAETSPKELLKKTGLLDWMQNELSVKFQEVGKMLRGEIPLKPVVMDLRPLKNGLHDQAIKEYLMEVMKNLPVCEGIQQEEWAAAAENPEPLKDLPACRPAGMDINTSTKAVKFVQEHEIEEIPDEVTIFKHNHRFNRGIDFIHNLNAFTYFLFIIPAIFILVAALIGGTGKSGVLRWMAFPTFIAGVFAYALSSLIKHAVPWSAALRPEAQTYIHSHSITPFEQLVVTKVGDIGTLVIGQILKGVNSTAGIVCVVAVVLYAFSYFVNDENHSTHSDSEPQRQSPKTNQPMQPQQPRSTSEKPQE